MKIIYKNLFMMIFFSMSFTHSVNANTLKTELRKNNEIKIYQYTSENKFKALEDKYDDILIRFISNQLNSEKKKIGFKKAKIIFSQNKTLTKKYDEKLQEMVLHCLYRDLDYLYFDNPKELSLILSSYRAFHSSIHTVSTDELANSQD